MYICTVIKTLITNTFIMTDKERKTRISYIKKLISFYQNDRNRKTIEKEKGQGFVNDLIDELLDELKDLI